MLALFVATVGWVLVTLWLSIRLVRRWLRWADRRGA
jgi:Kef-type K+ transport system membrane component KefB